MTTRDRIISAILAAFILVAGGAFLYVFFYARPLAALQGSITQAQADVAKKEKLLRDERARNTKAYEVSPRLEKWKQFSMPTIADKDPKKVQAFQEKLQGDYLQVLEKVMRDAGFAGANFTITPKELPRRSATGGLGGAQANGKKGPPYTAMAYVVTATGPYEKFLKAMEGLYHAPVLHEIKNFTLEKATDSGRGNQSKSHELKATILVEALQVEGAEKRPDLMPDPDKVKDVAVLASAGRSYEQPLLQNNIFFGKPPPIPEKKPTVTAKAERIKERPIPKAVATVAGKPIEELRDVLGVIKLVQIAHNGRRWEAFYYDQGIGGDDRMLNLGFRNHFEFRDKYENVLIKGTILNISTTREIYFKADDGHYYRWRIGEFLDEAVRRPLEVVAADKKIALFKSAEESEGLAVMSLGDILDPYERPAANFGLGVGLAGLLAPAPQVNGGVTVASRNAAAVEKSGKKPVIEDRGREVKTPELKKEDKKTTPAKETDPGSDE